MNKINSKQELDELFNKYICYYCGIEIHSIYDIIKIIARNAEENNEIIPIIKTYKEHYKNETLRKKDKEFLQNCIKNITNDMRCTNFNNIEKYFKIFIRHLTKEYRKLYFIDDYDFSKVINDIFNFNKVN